MDVVAWVQFKRSLSAGGAEQFSNALGALVQVSRAFAAGLFAAEGQVDALRDDGEGMRRAVLRKVRVPEGTGRGGDAGERIRLPEGVECEETAEGEALSNPTGKRLRSRRGAKPVQVAEAEAPAEPAPVAEPVEAPAVEPKAE